MRASPLFSILLLPILLFAEQQVTGVITEVVDPHNRKFVFLDIDNTACQKIMTSSLSSNNSVQYFSQNDNTGRPTGPILVQKKSGKIMTHENAGKDLGIGAGLCVAGCLFVLVAGEETPRQQPEGFYATVGNKTATGGPACIAGLLGTTGIVFLFKGFIELFLPSGYAHNDSTETSDTDVVAQSDNVNKRKTDAFSIDMLPKKQSTAEILSSGNYKIVTRLEKTTSLDNFGSIESWMKRYCLSL